MFFYFLIMLALYYLPVIFIKTDFGFYQNLTLPNFAPPQIVFPIAWAIIYLLNSIFFAIIFRHYSKSKKGISILIVWTINYLLNISYTYFFFNLQNLYLSLAITVLIFATTLMIFIDVLKLNKKVGYLLLPYLLWSFYASILSVAIYLLN